MKDLFLTVTEISLSTSIVILILLALSPVLNRRYAAKWKYGIWLLLALRLAVPVAVRLPRQKIVLDVPVRMTAPITYTASNAVTLPIQTQGPRIAPLDILAWIWLAGAAAFLILHLTAYFRCRREVLKNGVLRKNREFTSQLRSLCRELNIRGDFPVMIYDKAASPMVLGFFHPILVFPAGEYGETDLFFVLKHELIHLKRHDVFGKFLLVLANAVHWFNPLVYLMQREAVVDMELSCDEQVVRGTPYTARRAYTETLLSTVTGRCQKTTRFCTQFYGGKAIMKKRLKNILTCAHKRNGMLLLVVTITAALVLGMITGCSAQKPDAHEFREPSSTADATVSAKGIVYNTPQPEAQNSGEPTSAVDTAVPAKGIIYRSPLNIRKEPSAMSEVVGFLSVDDEVEILEIQGNWGRVARGWIYLDYVNMDSDPLDLIRKEQIEAMNAAIEFAQARFQNDMDAMDKYLVNTWEGMFWHVTFEGTPEISEQVMMLQRSGDISLVSTDPASLAGKEIPTGSKTTMSIEVRDGKDADNFIVCLIREETGWKVYDFGFETMEGFGQLREEPNIQETAAGDEDVPESEPALPEADSQKPRSAAD